MLREVLDRTFRAKQWMQEPSFPPDKKPVLEELIAGTLDNVCGMQLRWAFERVLDELTNKGVIFTISSIDFRNLSGLNSYFEKNSPEEGAHEQANTVLREIALDAIQKYAR